MKPSDIEKVHAFVTKVSTIGVTLVYLLAVSGVLADERYDYLLHRPRIDIETMLIAMAFLLVAVGFPAFNDTFHYGEIRTVDYVKILGQGIARHVLAIAVLLLLGIVTVGALLFVRDLASTTWVVLGFTWLMPFLFEVAYGYRSFILQIAGRSLFATALIACWVQSPAAKRIHPYEISTLLHSAPDLTKAWGALFLVMLGWIAGTRDRHTLVPKQKWAHVLYALFLGFGHLWIYQVWIAPEVSV